MHNDTASDTAHIVFIHVPSVLKPAHIFMARNRVSKSCLMAELCLDCFVDFDWLLIYVYIYKRWNWSSCTELTLSASWTYGMIAECLNRIQWSWIQISFRPTLYSYFKESFSGEYPMYQLILLRSCNYLRKISIKINVATDEDNSRNEIRHWTNDEIGVALQNWLWVQVEFMAW